MLSDKHMPKGPKGQKRPADVISNAVHVMRIATGEIDDDSTTDDGKNKAAVELGRKGGQAIAKKGSDLFGLCGSGDVKVFGALIEE